MKTARTSIRPLRFQPDYLPHAEGSCLISMGKTQVLCVATVEEKGPPHAQEKGIGWVHAEYSMLPRSGEKRTSRSRATTGGRSQEISRLIGRALRACVDLSTLAPYSVIIDCDVIRADGGTRTASINGGFVALATALKKLKEKNKLSSWPIKSFIGAVSCGLVQKKIIMDMAYEDDLNADTDLNVVMTSSGKLIEVQGTAEGAPFSMGELNQMLLLSGRAIKKITRAQKNILAHL